ncbi:hypothetical protein [Agromyces bauzanensis]|uniref:NTP pyrophosphohydrolase n=1 Tax=Agromyces bauzanensis TaxID=1308924 RepID=A0A917USU7_9MICO|nr:hypothetical protein [Agromyces bauzanensis]GGJ82905.1 hypothetical protein GCM10011372_21500 [Agromyces bauzanensis]
MSGNDPSSATVPVCVVVDVANVVGSRPDGWWRERAGAATRLLASLPGLLGREASVDAGDVAARRVRIERIVAVVEGAATSATAPDEVTLVRAPHDGDSAIVSTAAEHVGTGARVVVVTADRGLRARLSDGVLATGPGWLNDLLGR